MSSAAPEENATRIEELSAQVMAIAAEVRPLVIKMREARAETIARRSAAIESLCAAVATLAECDEILAEIGRPVVTDEDAADVVRHELSRSDRNALVRIDGSATDLALSFIGLTASGATVVMLATFAGEMGASFTIGALHGAIHRLARRGWIKQEKKRKGAPYLITREGAHEWNALMRRREMRIG